MSLKGVQRSGKHRFVANYYKMTLGVLDKKYLGVFATKEEAGAAW